MKLNYTKGGNLHEPIEGEKKMKKKTYIEMDYMEFEELVAKYFGRKDYEFIADVECGNDSNHIFNIKKEVLNKYDKEHLNEWKLTGKGTFMAHYILTELANMGVLEEGRYLISVSW